MADAQVAEISQQVVEILLWGALLLVAVIVLFGGVWYYRRRWLNPEETGPRQPWTLDDLRQMKQAGQITPEEYQALRETLIAAFRGRNAGEADLSGRNSVNAVRETQNQIDRLDDGF